MKVNLDLGRMSVGPDDTVDCHVVNVTDLYARVAELETELWLREEELAVAKHMEEQYHDVARFLLWGRGSMTRDRAEFLVPFE